jgi:hypothetical protein
LRHNNVADAVALYPRSLEGAAAVRILHHRTFPLNNELRAIPLSLRVATTCMVSTAGRATALIFEAVRMVESICCGPLWC